MEDITINLNAVINKISHGLILKYFQQNEGSKNLILSNSLPRVLERIISFNELKSLDVNKIFYIDNKIPKGPNDHEIEWIYIVRPVAEEIRLICNSIKEDLRRNFTPRYPYKILFSPRKLYICDLMIEQEGLFEYVTFGELQNDFVVLDDDVMSMEYPQFLSNYFLYGDQTWFNIISKALINIQDWFEKIPKVHLHGPCAKGVFELYKRLSEAQQKEGSSSSRGDNCKIGQLIIVDRSIDLITPFCSPLLYEALLHEYFKISSGFIDIPTTEESSSKTKRIKLSNDEPIFKEIRSMHISEIFYHLKNKVLIMKSIQEKKNDITEIKDMKDFIKTDLKSFNLYKESVNTHLNLSDIIINQKTHLEFQVYLSVEHNILINQEYRRSFEYIEELISRNFKMSQVLRLMILLSKTNDGIPQSDYQQLVNQFLHTYGYDKINLIQKLKKFSLFDVSENLIGKMLPTSNESSKSNLLNIQYLTNKIKNSSNYGNIKKKFEIIPSNLPQQVLKSTSKDVDASYAFNGTYRPILCRYISKILFPEPNTNLDEYSKLLPGDYEFISRSSTSTSMSIRNRDRIIPSDRVVLILFLGGCTYSELAVLKKLAAQKNYKFLFATTAFLNADSIIDLLNEN